jgi:hypothetical protein
MRKSPLPITFGQSSRTAKESASRHKETSPRNLNRNLPQVLAEVIQRVNEYEVAALGAALTPALAWRSRSV